MRRKILLADDDKDDRFIFDQAMEDLGKDLSVLDFVENGAALIDYLNKIEEDNRLPDLIILDHNMPKMNGMQTLSYLKKNDRYKNITVIVYSTYSDAFFAKEYRQLGAASIVAKPSTYAAYVDMVKQLLCF
jgi:CheY-like chemotaxis protein